MSLPLAGVRVLDLSSVIMGPYATQILADLGADVVTVEEPGGTLNRVMTDGPHPQLSGLALNLLRNKRNVVLNLKMPTSRTVMDELLAASDVFVTNLRPRALERLGLAYDQVAACYPALVYCQAQGWPLGSDRADDPAYDDIIQAASGMPDASMRASGRAEFAPTILADKVCGLTIAYAVIAALHGRSSTGVGTHVEVPMVEVMRSFLLVEHGAGAIAEPPVGPPGYKRVLVPERAPQRTLDGWVSVLPYSRENYEALFAGAGRRDLIGDARVRSARRRVRHAGELYAIVAEIVATQTTEHWAKFCAEASIPFAVVPTLDELVAELPVDRHPVAGDYHVIPQPVRFGHERQPVVRLPAALPGQHTDEVLNGLGLASELIAQVHAEAQTLHPIARSTPPATQQQPDRPPDNKEQP